MITDGNGNVLAGGERGGKSHITYKPYGEILRTDSFGPDITKFKYTGQEEDQESGLYYYKARYYDASLGRFASNDSMVFPDKEQGMNRMMYVEGNPIAFVDPSGNNAIVHMFNQFFRHAFFGAAKIATQQLRSLGRGLDYSGRNAGRGIDGGFKFIISGGKFKRQNGNDLDNLFQSGNFFKSLARMSGYNKLFVSSQFDYARKIERDEKKEYEKDSKIAFLCPYTGYKDCRTVAGFYISKHGKESFEAVGYDQLIKSILTQQQECEQYFGTGVAVGNPFMQNPPEIPQDCINRY
ncbi:RHS repeat-associated core domain-containing protein [Leptospira brenneri]